jgi:hypothetical protein
MFGSRFATQICQGAEVGTILAFKKKGEKYKNRRLSYLTQDTYRISLKLVRAVYVHTFQSSK